MADWDAEDFDPAQGFAAPPVNPSDRWEGEDEEEVKDTWEDSDDEKKEAKQKESEAGKAVQVKKKKSIEATLKARAEKRKKELAEQQAEPEVLSKEEQLAEKLQQQKMQEDADLELAKEAFGVTDDGRGRLDALQPVSPEEFEEFGKLLKEKLQSLEKSPHYMDLLDDVFQACSISLEADQVKRLGASLTAIASEKAKALKVIKSKKKSKKAALAGSGKSGKGIDDNYDEGGYDDMDGFM